ncbi:hypothetical protein LCL95_10800 [Bacillus timonensis]|nr:hypothetical protein [Bacillus timonensis]
MKKKILLLLTMGLSILFASACGTTQNSNANEDATNGASPPTEERQNENEDTGEEVDQSKEEQDKEVIRLLEQQLTYMFEGASHEETGFLNTSTNQGFSLYVFEGFQLESEEPGKDIVLNADDKKTYMRVELLNQDTDWNMVEAASLEQLKVVSETVDRNVWTNDALLDGTIILKANSGNEWVQTLLFKGKDHLPAMKVTMHASKDGEIFSKMIAMALTIQAVK